MLLSVLFSMVSYLPAKEISSVTYPVGELGEQWKFPSDHLPVGGSVGNIHFAMWNILDTDYLNYIVSNSQGLRDSLIMELNIPVKQGSLFTEREALVVTSIHQMINHESIPRSLLALQETGTEVFKKLQETLPSHLKMIPSRIEDLMHGDIFIYDDNVFDFVDFTYSHYKVNPGNTMMALTLVEKNTGMVYRFFQSHVPGGPINSDPAREEMANTLFNTFDPTMITIVMGDMNRSPDFFLKNFENAAKSRGISQPFKNMPISYPTHINTHCEASWIDNIFIANPHKNIHSQASDANSFFDELKNTVELLEKLK